MNQDYALLESKIGYEFKNKELLLNALTHTSFAFENRKRKLVSNERLEFLGDAVLEMVSSEFLFLTKKDMPEGAMTKLRASLVCEPTLAMEARNIGLEDFLYLGHGEENSGGRNRDSIISDALEALIGAMYLDGGIVPVKKFIIQYVLRDIENKTLFYDAKTTLQERINATKSGTLSYEIIREWGPDHNKNFEVIAKLDDEIIGQGTGRTKKAAQQQAAIDALTKIDKRN